MFLHLYVFYVCATFHCIWRSGFKVICTLVNALKSKMAAISMETKRGKIFVLFFSPYFFMLIIITVQWNEWVEKWAKQFLDQHLPLIHCITNRTVVFNNSTTFRHSWKIKFFRQYKYCTYPQSLNRWQIRKVYNHQYYVKFVHRWR